MPFSFEEVEIHLDLAVGVIFEADTRVHAVGIGGSEEHGFQFAAIRNVEKIVPLGAPTGSVEQINDIDVQYWDVDNDVAWRLDVPASGPGSPTVSSFVPEQRVRRPLVMGLQIQNFDGDDRSGRLPNNCLSIGTLGCFVERDNGDPAILSNNHVVAAENDGRRNQDRILQAGSVAFDPAQYVATLADFETLRPSPQGAKPHRGNIVYNEIDAGIAVLGAGNVYSNEFLPRHNVPSILGTASPKNGDLVFKVGRTTGLRWGRVAQAVIAVGPIDYGLGECWFRQSFTIVSENGGQFSDKGDSGSAIVRDDGYILGLLYAGNGTLTFACPMDKVMTDLNCRFP